MEGLGDAARGWAGCGGAARSDWTAECNSATMRMAWSNGAKARGDMLSKRNMADVLHACVACIRWKAWIDWTAESNSAKNADGGEQRREGARGYVEQTEHVGCAAWVCCMHTMKVVDRLDGREQQR